MSKSKTSKTEALSAYIEDKVASTRAAVDELATRALDPHATFDDKDALDEGVEDLLRYQSFRKDLNVQVKSEPLTYVRGGEHSYIKDLITCGGQVGVLAPQAGLTSPVPGLGIQEARTRLLRHREEVQPFYEVHNRDAEGAILKSGGSTQSGGSGNKFAGPDGKVISGRSGDLSNLSGFGGEFLPPRWFGEYFASVARSASTVRNLIGVKPLPDGTLQLNIPRLDSAVEPVEPQTAENTAVAESEGTTSDSVQASVITLSGHSKVSLQMLERGSGIDEVFLQEFAESWAAGIENQLLNGTGGVYQLTGLANLSNLLTVTVGAGASGYDYVIGLGQAAAAVSAARKRPVNAIILNSRRYAWLASAAADAGGEPVIRPGTGNVPLDEKGAFGPVAGFAVYLSDAIPVTAGADVAYAIRSNDMLVFESIPHFDVFEDVDGYSDQLSVSVGCHGYAAFFGDRFQSTCQLSGPTLPAGY
jgi:HK97 family phage major capsid protein